MKKRILLGWRTELEITGFLMQKSSVMKFYFLCLVSRDQADLICEELTADSGCCGKALKDSQGNLWPSLCRWLSLGVFLSGKWQWVGVAGEETETRTIDLNLNRIQKKTMNSRRKNTGLIYLGGSENIKFFQVTSGGVIEEIYRKHTA